MGTAPEPVNSLADEQAALRRVATLVAQGASSGLVFSSVAREVSQVMRLPMVALERFDGDRSSMTVLAASSDRPHAFQVGTRWPLDGESVTAQVLSTGRPARVEDYADVPGTLAAGSRASGLVRVCGAPIVVDGRVWGAIVVSSPDARFPEQIEDRLAQFTDLVATAIANSQARDDLRRLVDEQAALRRVATLAAQGPSPSEVFDVVTREVAHLVPADDSALSRFEPDGTVSSLAHWGRIEGSAPIGRRFPIEPGTITRAVLETGRPGRVNGYDEIPGSGPATGRTLGWRSAVGAPIIVEGRLWGVVTAALTTDRQLPADTEWRLAQFADLVAVAIANAENRAELAASRARIVATADAARRRIERDLHDGAQQQLVTLALELRAAQEALPAGLGTLHEKLSGIVDGLTGVLDELREIGHGIHPAILARGGLGPALRMLGRRSPVPVELDLGVEAPLPERVEVAAYYVVAEALANAAKHAHASLVRVDATARDRTLQVSVRDDGRGGADPARGTGLLGLKDRVEAMGGAISLSSPQGGGTSVLVELPLDDP